MIDLADLAIVAFDPGKTTGWARFHGIKKAPPIAVGEAKGTKDLVDVLSYNSDVNVFVVEDYKIRPNVNHQWNSGTPMRAIGIIEGLATLFKIEFVLQQPAVKPVGYGLAGLEYKKGKSGKGVHQFDAIAHGAYYLEKKYGEFR